MEDQVKQAKQTKGTFTLPNEIVKIEFIKKERGNIKNPNHVLFGGMGENSTRDLVPKRSKSTYRYIKILNEAEQKVLEKELFLEEGGLSVHRSKDNYWDTISVGLKKNGINLDLSDPVQYIKYKIALSYDNLVASSLSEKNRINKATYMFVVVRKGEKSNETVSTYNLKKEAYKIAAGLEVDVDRIKEFLYLAGVKISRNADITWFRAKLGTMVEDEPEKVVQIGSSADYTVRSLIARGVLTGVIKEIGGKYQLEDGIMLAEEGEIASLPNAIKFLNNKANSEIKIRIESKIGN